jgi:molecular chaperone GrpE (heat shock protein)
MTDQHPKTKSRPIGEGSAVRLNALDLAMLSQQVEVELEELVRHVIPLLDRVQTVCSGFVQYAEDLPPGKAESVELLAGLAEETAAACEIEQLGVPGERVARGLHEVVGTRPTEAAGGTVLEVVEHGWTFRGKRLCPARVIVGAVKDNA